VANWVTGTLFSKLNETSTAIDSAPVAPTELGGLVDLIDAGTISGRIAKEVFDEMFESGRPAAEIVKERDLEQVSDSGAIEAMVDQVLADNADKVAEYRGGKHKLLGFFVGQIMQASQGKANPKVVNELLKGKLEI
jgi:aspartyl-tRNA(Asn)/glutamyl-tRNA(Gln) amidotransferase subunit B